ncbi:Armadillo repeat-containing protein 10 [Acipenser ruthenus]|uniref:Armadillo repeat-containing protein 10 n=1 Tax=Acipenser ruthenus TaxID=7906 RepID=A0A444UNC1_ACIRT|nr:Armadillo repeat-containing protein 10 [Acipenser ruthenus]
MGDEEGAASKLFNTKVLLGLVAGAGFSYGLYKLIFSGGNHGKKREDAARNISMQPGSLLERVSGLPLVHEKSDLTVNGSTTDELLSKSPNSLEPHHLEMLFSLLQTNPDPSARIQVLVTLGNSAAFSVNQDYIRKMGGLQIIGNLLSDPAFDVRVQALNALNNLSMNATNQEQLKVYVRQVLGIIETSHLNSDLQLAGLRMLTNMSVTNNYQYVMKSSITLFLSLLVVGNVILQDYIRKMGGLQIIGNLLSDPAFDVRVQALNALNNLSMNATNQEQLKVYVRQVLGIIETSHLNSDLQLAGLRMLTNMSVTNNYQYVMKSSITLFLSLLVVGNVILQAPVSLVLLFDSCTNTEVLLRVLTFVGNLKDWTTSTNVTEILKHNKDSLYSVLYGDSSELHQKLPLLLSHTDGEVKSQVAKIMT